jgi:hypothetical protein
MRAQRILIAVSSLALAAGGGLAMAPTASAIVVCPTVDPTTHLVSSPSPAPGVDWRGCDLTGADLASADLTDADLSGADLTGASFFDADMVRTVLTGANLTGANLSIANLPDANLSGANLTNSNLTEAFLTRADLTGAFVTCSDSGVLGTDITRTTGGALPEGWTLITGTLSVPITPCPVPIMWLQSIGRTSLADRCANGYTPSWAMWPNDGAGGYVCDRFVRAYGS